MLDEAALADLPGKLLLDREDHEVGTVDDVFAFTATDVAAWVSVRVGASRRLVPLEGAKVTARGVRAAWARDVIEGAPEAQEDSVRPSRELYEHFGLTDAQLRDDTGFPADGDSRANLHPGDPRGPHAADDATQGHP